jgi:hypothetical protein
VLHGGVIGELCHQITRSRRFAFIHADNCSITRVVQFAIGHRMLRSFNDTAHLALAARRLAPCAVPRCAARERQACTGVGSARAHVNGSSVGMVIVPSATAVRAMSRASRALIVDDDCTAQISSGSCALRARHLERSGRTVSARSRQRFRHAEPLAPAQQEPFAPRGAPINAVPITPRDQEGAIQHQRARAITDACGSSLPHPAAVPDPWSGS